MTTFSKTNFKSLNYNSFRPHYPPSFYKILADYVTKVESPLPINLPIDKTIDLGCGTGVATYPLLNISTNVIGVDLSSKMIETANSLIEKNLQTLVEEFVKQQQQNKDHSIASTLEPNSIDLITAAQCIHWFQDYNSFFQNCHQLLKNDTGRDTQVKYQVYNKYVYDDDNYIGQYWEQPGRNILKHFCQQVNEKIPRDLYTDIVINTFKPSIEKNNSGNTSIANEEVDLDLKNWNFNSRLY
ncbi:Methyltransferase domain family protein [Candida albicans]|uniref:Methyltransferase domain family protein n=1 Tax=Candida albicans TaxID=5476 RepID=A0A8H6BTV5_CANAX|nr:Methyltransferase domain family protein [Candida albicans]